MIMDSCWNPTKVYNLTKALGVERRILSITSFYPVDTKKFKIFNTICGIIGLMLATVEFLSMFILIFFELDNLAKVAEILVQTTTQFAFVCKLCSFIYNKKLITSLETILESDMLTKVSARQYRLLENHVHKCRLLMRTYRIICTCSLSFYLMYPLIDKNEDRSLPVPGWFPVDIDKYYTAVYIGEAVCLFSSTLNNITIDILTFTFIILGNALFKILLQKLGAVAKDLDLDLDVKSKDVIINGRLRECVIQHNILLSYISLIEELFSKGLFIQVVISVFGICVSGFQILMIPLQSTQFFSLAAYLCAILSQIAIYCICGHLVMHTSSEIPQACYMSDWRECGSKVRKILFIIMERSRIPVTLTAGNLFVLNLDTLVAILKSSYSYFAVLQQLYKV